GRPRSGRPCSSCERDGQTPGDPGGGYRGSFPVGDRPGGFQQRTRRGHREAGFEVPRCIRPRRPRASPGGRGAPSAAEIRSQGAIMSLKKEASGRRSIQVEVEVPGTPEEVWRAIATGPGVSSWFVPTEVDERVGGAVTAHFGPGMDSSATITVWDRPRRFAA